MKHFIPLADAIRMTAFYRREKENILKESEKGKDILPKCETFDRAPFDAVLTQPGCVGIRIYYGMDTEKMIHTIIVGVNDKNEDMLPVSLTEITNSNIIEEGGRCPPICPPDSPLNLD